MTRDYRHWTPAEDEYLKANYKTMTNSELAEGTGRNEPSVSSRLSILGLARNDNRRRRWSEEDTEEIKALHPEYTAPQIAERMGWGTETIYKKLDELGLKKRKKKDIKPEWTEEDDDYVMKHFDTMGKKEIAKRLGRTPSAVRQKQFTFWIKKMSLMIVLNISSLKKKLKTLLVHFHATSTG